MKVHLQAVVASALLLLCTAASAQTVSLDGGWQLLADRGGSLNSKIVADAPGWRDARVGLSWNAQFEDLRDYAGVAWYRTHFECPTFAEPRKVLLRFGAVDYVAEVFINGTSVGFHEGGYTPFTLAATAAVHAGWNELIVRVVDPPMDERENRERFPQWMYNEIPHGKQNWYVQTGGIWQGVDVLFRPQLYVEQLHITPSISGEFKAEVRLAGERSREPVPMSMVVRDDAGKQEFAGSLMVGGPGTETVTGRVQSPRLWGPESPALYSVEVRLGKNGEDVLQDRFGFRSFEAKQGRLYLNGQPFYMRSALDQDFYPETLYTPPSASYIREMMRKGKQLGLNLLRCHIKVPDPRYLEAADETGLLVWYEIPSWNDDHHYTPEAAARGEKTLSEMVDRDWNHPSIVIQSIINESWGADLKQEEQRRWLLAAFDRAKMLTAPLGRLIDDNSACCQNFHVKSDLDDFHQYFSIPDQAKSWDRWVADFASRPRWSFSPFGDARRTGQEPLIVSEFGNWGLPQLPVSWPWWYGRDFGGREVTRPAGVLDRFRQYRLDTVFGDFDSLANETQQHQFLSLKHEIEEMRRYSSIQGYVITELTDINWEANGLMDMWRQPKIYARELSQVQQNDTVLARLSKHNFWSGEEVQLQPLVSHYSHQDFEGAELRWEVEPGTNGRFQLQQMIAQGEVTELPAIFFRAPVVEGAARRRITIEVRSRNGEILAENSYEMFVYPRSPRVTEIEVSVHEGGGRLMGLAEQLSNAGYRLQPAFGPGILLVAAQYDSAVREQLAQGGTAILLIEAADGLPRDSPLKVELRGGSDLDGNWVTNFNWVRASEPPFHAVAFSRVLGWEAEQVMPQAVIQGVPDGQFNDVLAGTFYGWLNHNATLAAQARVGRGRLLLTTFRFHDYGTDPYATRLLDSILQYVSGPGFAPQFSLADGAGKP